METAYTYGLEMGIFSNGKAQVMEIESPLLKNYTVWIG